MYFIASAHGDVLVITDYEEVDTGLQNTTRASIQDSRSHTQVKIAALLQQKQFLKQQNRRLETEINTIRVNFTDILGNLHKAVL